MSNPAFFVDGYTEKKIIQDLCPGQPIRRTDLNGKNVSLEAIAKKIASLIRLLGNKYYPIIILLDRESRKISFDSMATEIKKALVKEGITDQDLRIGVADKMIENWILADWQTLDSNKRKPLITEGTNGAAIIKNIKGSYDKTTDGVFMFQAARQKELYANSSSYKHFIDQLTGIDCNYLNFDR